MRPTLPRAWASSWTQRLGSTDRPTDRTQYRSRYHLSDPWSYLRYVSHVSVWSNSIHPPNTSPNKNEYTTCTSVTREGSHTVELSLS